MLRRTDAAWGTREFLSRSLGGACSTIRDPGWGDFGEISRFHIASFLILMDSVVSLKDAERRGCSFFLVLAPLRLSRSSDITQSRKVERDEKDDRVTPAISTT